MRRHLALACLSLALWIDPPLNRRVDPSDDLDRVFAVEHPRAESALIATIALTLAGIFALYSAIFLSLR